MYNYLDTRSNERYTYITLDSTGKYERGSDREHGKDIILSVLSLVGTDALRQGGEVLRCRPDKRFKHATVKKQCTGAV